jgi:DME family drug/metabolite transporter
MRHVVFVLLAAICFGTTATVQEFGPDEASAVSVGAVRIAIGGGALALIAWLARAKLPNAGQIPPALGGKTRARFTSAKASARASAQLRAQSAATGSIPITPEAAVATIAMPGRTAAPTWLVVALGAAGVVAYQPAFFLGASLNGVAVGTIVALGSAPIITGALEWAVTRVFPGMVWLAATLIASIGVVLLTGVGGADAVSVEGLGASLGAGASYGVYGLASKRLLVRGWTPTAAMGSVFGWAAAACVPLMLVTDIRWLGTVDGIAMALWLGLAATTVGYLLYARGLKGLSASTVSTLTLAEPLTASLLGILLLGESLSSSAVVGISVLALGLVLLVLPRRAPAVSA